METINYGCNKFYDTGTRNVIRDVDSQNCFKYVHIKVLKTERKEFLKSFITNGCNNLYDTGPWSSKNLFNLQEILKHTPEDHPERLNLERAVEKMLEACSEVMDLIKLTVFFVTDAKA
jgi:hypothetical protein